MNAWTGPGPWIALALTFISLLITMFILTWRAGAHSARVTSVEQTVANSLKEMNLKMDAFSAFIKEFVEIRSEWNSWRGRTDERLDRAEDDILRIRDQVHNTLVPKAQQIMAHEDRIQRLEKHNDKN